MTQLFIDVDPDTGALMARPFTPGDGSLVARKAQLAGNPAPGWTLKPAGGAEPAPIDEAESALDD